MTDKEAIDNLKNYIECLMEDYGYYKDIVEFRDSVEHLEKSLQTQQAEIEKLRNNNKDLLRKLRNRVKEVKKLTKYSLYKKEFSTLNEHLKKKDKITDEMATYIATLDIEEDIKALQQQRKRFADGRVPAYTADTYMKIGALIDAYNLILKDNEQMNRIQQDLSDDIAELFDRLEKRTKELIPKYIIELKLEELIKNQELTEQGILNRESIEEKEEIGAIKVLKEILETVEKGAEE